MVSGPKLFKNNNNSHMLKRPRYSADTTKSCKTLGILESHALCIQAEKAGNEKMFKVSALKSLPNSVTS